MGTNYYAKTKCCPMCARPEERLHIGKASFGWCFSLHVDPDKGINTLDDWVKILGDPATEIEDEYGDGLGLNEMMSIIRGRRGFAERDWTPEQYARNYAEPGPNGLIRHKINGWHCVGHGEGTWDYIVGEFS